MKRILCSCLSALLLFACSVPAFASSAVPSKVIDTTNSVVRILAEYSDGTCTGSGFVIKSDKDETLIASNLHVVDGDPLQISVWADESNTVSASILAYTDQKDLCVLKLAYPIQVQPLQLAAESAKQGDAVYAVGFPAAADSLSDREAHAGESATITNGIVSAVRQATIASHGAPVMILQINAAINSGNSGGPLFNSKGEVIGVNTLGITDSQGIFGALDVSELRSFLEVNGLLPEAPPSFRAMAVIAAAVITVLILCLILIKKRNTKANTASNSKAGKAPLFILCIVVTLALAVYWGSYALSCCSAKNDDFVQARSFLLWPAVTQLHDADLVSYIEAGQMLAQRQYSDAHAAFLSLSGYRNADELAKEAQYRQALQYADANEFDMGIEIMESLSAVAYKDAEEKVLDLKYREAMAYVDEENYFRAKQLLNQIPDHPKASMALENLTELMYLKGQELYHEADYERAEAYLGSIDGYKSSKQYLELIYAKTRGSDSYNNPLLCHIVLSELIPLIGFEDAANILVSNSNLACCFLNGTWKTADNRYYFKMEESQNVSYRSSYNLSSYSGSFEITDGIYAVRTNSNSSVPQFKFTVLSKDSIRIYCYQDGKTYMLYRQ